MSSIGSREVKIVLNTNVSHLFELNDGWHLLLTCRSSWFISILGGEAAYILHSSPPGFRGCLLQDRHVDGLPPHRLPHSFFFILHILHEKPEKKMGGQTPRVGTRILFPPFSYFIERNFVPISGNQNRVPGFWGGLINNPRIPYLSSSISVKFYISVLKCYQKLSVPYSERVVH